MLAYDREERGVMLPLLVPAEPIPAGETNICNVLNQLIPLWSAHLLMVESHLQPLAQHVQHCLVHVHPECRQLLQKRL